MKCQVPESKRQSLWISMEPDRYDQNNLTVKYLLFSINFFSATSVLIIDNTLRGNKESISSSKKMSSNKSVKKKRKGKNTENDSVTITKKTKVIIRENQPDLTNV